MTDLATLQSRLTDAESALHALMTGAKVARVGGGGESVDYTPADAGRLASYIASLQRQIARAKARTAGVPVSPWVGVR